MHDACGRANLAGLSVLLIAGLAAAGRGDAFAASRLDGRAKATTTRPNVVVVVVDDLRWDEFGAAGHPFLETPNIDRLAREGAMFMNSFHAVPLCSPNRASILTGQYPSRHGIVDNVARNLASHHLRTFPQTLQESGYETGFLGKWHMGNDPTPRPGFDSWAAIPGQGRTTDPELYEDGRIHVVEGYVTDVLTDRAVAFIERERDRPFFLYLAHKAVHPTIQQLDDGSTDPATSFGYQPAPRHRGLYENAILPPRGNEVATLADLAGKPTVQRALMARLGVAAGADLTQIAAPQTDHEAVRRRAEMLLAVDEGLGRILEALERQGTLDQTLVMFTSENGFFYGEHGLTTERRMPYEEGIRNPLIIRYPPEAAEGARPAGLTLSVDIAPTILQVAGAPIGDHIAGESVVPLLRGNPHAWRQSALIEFFTYENPFRHLVEMDYRAVRTPRYKYIHWMKYPDEDELYDLEEDPYELHNVAEEPRMRALRDELRAELARLQLHAMGLDPGGPPASSAGAQPPARLPPEARQFDFWLGEWAVDLRIRQDDLTWRDSIQARAKIYSILDGKAVLELWDSESIKGYSLRYFDPERGEWTLWLNWPGENRAGSSSLSGSFRHGRGEFFSRTSDNGTETISRYTFSDITPSSLRWDDAFSSDGGKTWTNGWIMEFSRTADTVALPVAGGPAHTYADGGRCTLPRFRAYEGLSGRRTGVVGDRAAVMTGYLVLDGCAVLLLTETPGAGPGSQAFAHLTYNTYASRFELTHLDARPDSPAQIFYSQQDADELVLYPRGQTQPDRRVRFDIGGSGAVTIGWEVPDGDGWTVVFTSVFEPPS